VVVVSNLGTAEQVAQVKLNRERLQLPAGLQATDMLTGDRRRPSRCQGVVTRRPHGPGTAWRCS
jgi:hypothetical protein